MREEEMVSVIATASKACGSLWPEKNLDRGQKNGKVASLVLADGEKVVGVNFTGAKTLLFWSESGNIYYVDLDGNNYHKVGRPGRIHMISSVGCEKGAFFAVLAGGRPRVLLIETKTGRVRWRIVEEEEVKGVVMSGDLLVTWGDTRVGLWRISGAKNKSPQVFARLSATSSLAGVCLLKEHEKQIIVTVTKDGKFVLWKVPQTTQPKMERSLDLKVEVKAPFLAPQFSSLFFATAEGIVQLDLNQLSHNLLLPFPATVTVDQSMELKVFTTVQSIMSHQEVVPQLVQDEQGISPLPQELRVEHGSLDAAPLEKTSRPSQTADEGQDVGEQAFPLVNFEALLHLYNSTYLLQQSCAPLHLASGELGDSSSDGSLLARISSGRLELFKVKDAFSPLPKSEKQKRPLLHPTAKQPERALKSDTNREKTKNRNIQKQSVSDLQKRETLKIQSREITNKDTLDTAPTKLKVPREKPSSQSKAKAKAQEALQAELLERVDRASILPLLKTSTSGFPEKSRALVWTKLLQLPRNKKQHKKLLQANPSLSSLQGVLGACWPELQALPSLPLLIKPLSELFTGHPTTGFECAAVLLKDYLLVGLSASSGMPEEVFQLARSILTNEEPALSTQLTKINATNRQLFWPLLSTGWAVLLPHKDWLILWDHVVTVGPTLLPCVLVASLVCLAPTLLVCQNTWMVGNLLNSTLGIDLPKLLRLAHSFLEKYWRLIEAGLPSQKPGALSEVYGLEAGQKRLAGEREREREVLKEMSINTNTEALNEELAENVKQDIDLRLAVEKALSVGPPSVPRVESTKTKPSVNNPDTNPLRPTQITSRDRLPGPMDPLLPQMPTSQVFKDSALEDIVGIIGKSKITK